MNRLFPPTLALAAAVLLLAGCATSAVKSSNQIALPSLAKVYAPYFPVGAAVNGYMISAEGDFIASQVNSVTADNAMKWIMIHPRRGSDVSSYNFKPADAIVDYAIQHGMRVRGHNFVWHQQTPAWVFAGPDGNGTATKSELLDRLQNHISTVLAHYKGKVYAWDVVNEAISDGAETWRTDSPWFKIAGSDDDKDGIPDYIEKAFEYARAADPTVKLFYNDYNIESGTKLDKALNLVKLLKAKNLIDGVGIQGHWNIYGPDEDTVRTAIEQFAALGVEVQITELDLSVFRFEDQSSLPGFTPDLAKLSADEYGMLFKVFRDEAAAHRLTGVTFWGIADDLTWLDNFPVGGRKNWPLLFDTDLKPKPAFWTVVKW